MKVKQVVLWMSMIAISIMPLKASSIGEKKEELQATQESIKDSKEELKQVESEKAQLEKEVDTLDRKIIEAEEKLLDIEQDMVTKKAQVQKVENELAEAIKKKEYQYDATKKRMVQMYKNKKTGYIELIFSSGSLGELLNRAKYIKVISEYDHQLLEEYRHQEEVIENKRQLLKQEEAEIKQLYANQSATMEALEDMRADKNAKIKAKDSKANSLNAEIDEMEAISKELEKEIKRLTQKSTVKYSGGKFEWPVPGYYRISSEYNPRENPVLKIPEFHQGIDIPAPYGNRVNAAASGRVIVAGWVNGFGNTVMIDHGSGIVTIYGHNSSLVVNVGDQVSKGQQVARIGSTGRSTGNHCHFEVRINGRHTSPWNYLNK